MPSFSGLYDGVYNTPYSLLSASLNKGEEFRKLTTPFARRLYSHGALGELIVTLLGAAAGSTAQLQHKRVQSRRSNVQNVQGGAVPIETFTDVNRATTATDVSALVAALTQQSSPTYVVDRSGNGATGKSKLGY